ncbi:ATP-binding protein [Streptomyces sp. NPDC060028]|uniref:ATP-binding protein n=1 Tax=Streptomyces sp. NPDC060028 TaxID=3347041 RepID=UPI003687B0E4
MRLTGNPQTLSTPPFKPGQALLTPALPPSPRRLSAVNLHETPGRRAAPVRRQGRLPQARLPLAVQRAAAEIGLAVAAAELAAAAPEADDAGLTVVRTLAPLTVTGDATLLGHLVRNLLANAVRHNRAGGRIALVTTADGELTVSNTGPVMAPQDVPRLLEPFRRRAERQHTAGEGAGLGLSIVASIARAHGAGLLAEANPEPEGGLTLRVRFPVAEAPGP